MKLIRHVLAVVFLSSLAFSQASFVGGVALGSTFTNGIQVAQILPNASVTVCLYSAPTCDLAHLTTIYTDSTGVTPASNPVTADARGNFGFWALGGNYQYVIAYRGNSYGPFVATVQANDAAVVHLAGSESITGAKSFSQPITSTVSTGTAPAVVASTTKVTNLNADLLDGADWNAPPTIGAVTPGVVNSASGSLNGSLGATTPGTVQATSVDTNSLTFYGIPRTLYVASDFTLSANTNLQTISGLTFTLPANTALTVAFNCHLMYSQATAAVADQFGIQAATIAPTNIAAKGQVYTSTSASVAGNLPILATTTATAIVTFTPSAITTVFNADLSGFIENPSNASTNVINVMAQTSNAANLVTVKRGSFCKIF